MKGKPLVLEFFDYTIKPQTRGLKQVLFRVEDLDGKMVGYDFGFCEYGFAGFEKMITENLTARVVKWAEIPNPKLLF